MRREKLTKRKGKGRTGKAEDEAQSRLSGYYVTAPDGLARQGHVHLAADYAVDRGTEPGCAALPFFAQQWCDCSAMDG